MASNTDIKILFPQSQKKLSITINEWDWEDLNKCQPHLDKASEILG